MDEGQNPIHAESLVKTHPSEQSEGSAALSSERPGKREVRSGFWAALIIGFGSLIALIALSGLEALDRAQTISGQISRAYQNNLAVEKDLSDIRSQLQTSAILVRDYLLDRSPNPYDGRHERLRNLRKSVAEKVNRLESCIPAENIPNLTRMKREVDLYWSSLDPIFHWTAEEKEARSAEFVKTRVPRRAAILEIVSQIETLNENTLAKQRREI